MSKRRYAKDVISKEELTRLYIEERKTDKEIGLKHGFSKESIRRLRKKYGIETQTVENTISKEELECLYIEEGLSDYKIADMFSFSEYSIRRLRKKYGIEAIYSKVETKTNSKGEIISKTCSKCGRMLELNKFNNRKEGIGGRRAYCKECRKPQDRQQKKQYRQENKEQIKQYNKQYYHNNKELYRQKDLKRNHRQKRLPFTLTTEDLTELRQRFGNCFILREESDNTSDEHIVPMSWGGGYTPENILPMNLELNKSKNNKNIFEWFEDKFQNGEFDEEHRKNFIEGITYIAEQNGMSLKEYKDYYNQREQDFIDGDIEKYYIDVEDTEELKVDEEPQAI